jgi:hypothetical protein
MKAICIDSSKKPAQISEYEWIEEGAVYTITEVVELSAQDGTLGVAFEEVQLTEASAPYKYYALERFLIVPDNAPVVLNEYKSTTKLKNSKNITAEDADLSTLE